MKKKVYIVPFLDTRIFGDAELISRNERSEYELYDLQHAEVIKLENTEGLVLSLGDSVAVPKGENKDLDVYTVR